MMFEVVLKALQRRVGNMLIRALVVADDVSAALPTVQVIGRDGEVKDGIEHWLPYGFKCRPLPADADGRGAETILLAIDADHRIALVSVDRRFVVELAPGEAALHDDQGQVVHIKRNGLHLEGKNIYLKSDGIVRIEGSGVEVHGRDYVQTDVHGKGSRETWTGGVNYDVDSYTTGATGGSVEQGLDQPDLPSGHPEGP